MGPASTPPPHPPSPSPSTPLPPPHTHCSTGTAAKALNKQCAGVDPSSTPPPPPSPHYSTGTAAKALQKQCAGVGPSPTLLYTADQLLSGNTTLAKNITVLGVVDLARSRLDPASMISPRSCQITPTSCRISPISCQIYRSTPHYPTSSAVSTIHIMLLPGTTPTGDHCVGYARVGPSSPAAIHSHLRLCTLLSPLLASKTGSCRQVQAKSRQEAHPDLPAEQFSRHSYQGD